MPFLNRKSAPDSQNFAFPRRELPGKLLAIGAALLLLPERQSKVSVIPAQPQPQPQSQPQPSYPSPEFKIGDLVASDWENDEDDDEDEGAPDFFTDYGEILGLRWVPEPDSYSVTVDSWVYFVRWTHSTYDAPSCYPCYDGEPTEGSALRLVKQPGGRK